MIRVGIAGTGGIAEAHIRGYLAFPELCEIVALADLTPGRAANKKDQFALGSASAYDEVDTMLARGDIDLVSIATPPSSHAEIAIASFEAGAHVLLEKPMAPSLEDCDAILAAQRVSGRILSVVAQNRFRDDLATLKKVLDSGLIGHIGHVQIDSSWWRGLSYYDLWWRGTWASEGGGCTLNHAIHHIDLLLWLFGRPQEVIAMLANAQHDNAEVEDLSASILRYERGLVQLTASVVDHGEDQSIVVHGEHARVSQPWRAVAERAQQNGFPDPEGNPELVARLDALAAAQSPLEHTLHTGQIADVLDAIRAQREPAADGVDGRNAIELVTAIYRAGIEGTAVSLPLQPDDPYYRSGTLVERAPRFFEKTASIEEFEGDIVVGSSSKV